MENTSIRMQRGVAAVEFALVLPVLLLLMFITTEFGRALFEYDTVTKSVRSAARYLSTQTPGTGPTCPTAVQNLLVYGYTSPPAGAQPVAPGLATATLQCNWQDTASPPIIKTVTVTVAGYSFTSLFRTAYGTTFTSSGTLPFSNITATMRSHS